MDLNGDNKADEKELQSVIGINFEKTQDTICNLCATNSIKLFHKS